MSRLNLIWIAIVVIVAVVTAIWLYPSNDDFRTDNSSWNGLSTVNTRLEATNIRSFSELPAKEDGTVLISIPYSAFTATELHQVKAYVLGGGTLILMDDYGYGNQVLEQLGVDYRFTTGTPLLDPLINYKNASFPQITDFSDVPLVAGIESIVYNHASSLTGVPQSQIVARSSSFSFLDANGNQTYDDTEEEKGPFAVISSTVIGRGRLVAISDPSLIINGIIDMQDNYDILLNATMLATTDPVVYLDQSHLAASPLLETKAALTRVVNTLAHPVVLFGIVGATFLLILSPMWNKRR